MPSRTMRRVAAGLGDLGREDRRRRSSSGGGRAGARGRAPGRRIEVAADDEDLVGAPDRVLGGERPRDRSPAARPARRTRARARSSTSATASRTSSAPWCTTITILDGRAALHVLQHPPQGRSAADRVQDLLGRGPEALALAGGQHDRGERAALGHGFLSVVGHTLCTGGPRGWQDGPSAHQPGDVSCGRRSLRGEGCHDSLTRRPTPNVQRAIRPTFNLTSARVPRGACDKWPDDRR